MFLSSLNDPEKKGFLELASRAISADGKCTPLEEEILASYRYECGMPEFVVSIRPLEAIIEELRPAPRRTHRVVILELMGMLLADKDFADKERQFMQRLADTWQVDPSEYRRLTRWAKDFLDIVTDGYRLVGPLEEGR
ncbi:MAG: hypothetical protein A3K19_29660 [Lentisphaerae bacterium RIFOXYB12_FULL_65_16]|nr:MAG: hypothetical protein A3K18_33270 [Lentisphaerae bacterium RIFOXYA12_64_32]OGV86495.1 MAG: hypothetical protein A3K19_29660 [Lentisphaerae bacterium RIFOXYB12_FULL_65_16]